MTAMQQTSASASNPTATFTMAASVIALLAGPVVASIGLIYSGYGEHSPAVVKSVSPQVEVSEQVGPDPVPVDSDGQEFMFDDDSVVRCEILPGEEVCLDRFDPNG